MAGAFRCDLEDLPDHLTIRIGAAVVCPPLRTLGLNPWIRLPGEPLPSELYEIKHLLRAVSAFESTAWVFDPTRGMILPYSIPESWIGAIVALRAGMPLTDLPEAVAWLFWQAGVLLAQHGSATEFVRSAEAARLQYEQDGFAECVEIIPRFQLSALRRYFRSLVRNGLLSLGDRQSSRRYIAHNDPVACYFHHQMTKFVESIVGRRLKPSYVYFSSYCEGARLPRHTDRPQCEYSVSALIDATPDNAQFSPWPLYVETTSKTNKIDQNIGDGLIYRGRHQPHFRDELQAGRTSTSLFFHYVDSDFAGALY